MADVEVQPSTSPDRPTGDEPKFGTATATFVVVSSMIGVGVLTTSGLAVVRLGSNQLMLVLWVIGGLVALSGALSLAEVSASLPRSGGEYVIFREVYGRPLAFLAGWVSFLFGFAAPIAVAATGAADYLLAPLSMEGSFLSVSRSVLASLLILGMAIIHGLGRAHSVRLQGVVTILELVFLTLFAIAGLWLGRAGLPNLDDRPPVRPTTLVSMFFNLIYITYGYTGWNAASYIAGEVENPGRNLPRAIVFGTVIVTGLYLALNLAFALALPSTELIALAHESGETAVVPIARLAADRLFGTAWGQGLGLGVGMLLVATLSALLLTGPRVLQALLEDSHALTVHPQILSRVGIPRAASFLMGFCAVVLVWTGSFDQILIYSGLGLAMTSLLSVGAVLILRWRSPDLHRPFRVPLFPWVPLFFLISTSALTFAVVKTEPSIAAYSVLSIASGLPLYYGWQRLGGKI